MPALNLFHDTFDPLGLVAALVVGLLIGLERGWRDRELPEGGRVAGLRTFALTGLFGGVLASLLPSFGPWPLAGGLLGLALLLAIFFGQALRTSGNLSITTAVAMLLTLALGALAGAGAIATALAAAVIVTVLLNLKPTLHAWLRLIEHRELTAALQLLVLSVVILPHLPDAQFGPYRALNPYQLWWAVILIATLSLVGHIAMRATGPQRGLLWTGILGGLASSTAATLALARCARQQPTLVNAAAAGIVSACGVMFFRMAVLVGVIQPALIPLFGPPLVLTGLILLALGLRQWKKAAPSAPPAEPVEPMPPFDLTTALGFGAFLAVVAVLAPAARDWLGEAGIHALSVLSGIADVDAIAISLARLQGSGQLSAGTTALALGLATLSNMLVKAAMAWSSGGAAVGRKVAGGYALGLLALLLAVASRALSA